MSEVSLIPLSHLPAGQPHSVTWVPDKDTLSDLAWALDLTDLRKVRAEVTLSPQGNSDWHMSVRWGATVVQPCVVTLAPVTTRLEEQDGRTFTAHMPEISEAETEMPDDDRLDPLPDTVDLKDILREMISLALPPYPRAADAELKTTVFGPPGTAPMTDEDAKPFAGLASLKDKLGEGNDGPGS
ncbi:MAG: DUF177 domain-containing protein [Pseudomonadota bacterium]